MTTIMRAPKYRWVEGGVGMVDRAELPLTTPVHPWKGTERVEPIVGYR